MYEKLIKSKEELNVVAASLRMTENFEELRFLAQEWSIPLDDTEDFIVGKRYLLAEIHLEEKAYPHAEDKLMEEMWLFPDDILASQTAHHLLQKSTDEGFEQRILMKHKSLQKCMDSIMEKAYETAKEKRNDDDNRPFGMAVKKESVYQWAEDYYLLDDAESEEKKEEEEKKKILEERKQAAERKENLARIKKEPAGKKKKGAEAGHPEAEKKEPEVTQLSLFDTMKEPADTTDPAGGSNESI